MSARTRVYTRTSHVTREDIVPHDSREDRKRRLPNNITGHNVVASNPFRNGREIMGTRRSRIRDEAPSRKRRCNMEEEGLAKSQTNNIKRKREQEEGKQNEGCAGRGERFGLSYKLIKRRRPESQDSSSKPKPTIPLLRVLKPLSLDSFIFHKKLGQGSFGKVILASDRTSGEQVAVKVVKKRPLLKNKRIKRAMNEKRVLELAGGSPFLTSSYATFQTTVTDQSSCIIDPSCPITHVHYTMLYTVHNWPLPGYGGDLDNFITARAPLDISTTRFLTAEIICGLQYLHTMGIIHRDSSPENIFLDSTGHIKIGDYGLCATDVTGDNKASGCVGAEKYMAPEVFSQDFYDAAVDWFSLGVLMFKMATGKYSFYSGDHWPTLMQSVVHDRPAYPEGLSPDLKDVIDRLLCKDAETRLALGTNIRRHPFFAPIDWVKLEARKLSPPFHMAAAPLMDPSYYIPVGHFLSQREAQKSPISPEGQKIFWGFSHTSDRWRQLQHQGPPALQSILPAKLRLIPGGMQMSSSSKSSSSSSSS